MELLILVPVYNEEKNIGNVLDSLLSLGYDILVVDNKSIDKTPEIIKKKKVNVLEHKENLGKARSLIDGFNYAIEKDYNHVICMDGDSEHDPKYISQFIDKLGDYDLVVGERNSHRSFSRGIVNFWSSLWFNFVLGGIKDTQCGFRGIRTSLLKNMKLISQDFEIEIEILLEATRNNAKIGVVKMDSGNESPSQLGVKDYIKINNFFDRWIIHNIWEMDTNFFKKTFLFIFANIGLSCFRWFE